jgi:hypothetical protein
MPLRARAPGYGTIVSNGDSDWPEYAKCKSPASTLLFHRRLQRRRLNIVAAVATVGLMGLSGYVALHNLQHMKTPVFPRAHESLYEDVGTEVGHSTSRRAERQATFPSTVMAPAPRSAAISTPLKFAVNSKGYPPLKSTSQDILGYPWVSFLFSLPKEGGLCSSTLKKTKTKSLFPMAGACSGTIQGNCVHPKSATKELVYVSVGV